MDQGKGSITELLSTFKSKGEKAVTNYESAKSAKVESQSTSSSDSTNIDPNVLTRLKGISEKTGTPLNELISKYKGAKDLSKNVLVEKE
ncbi:hypothetical protein D3C81_1817440 [compost metagenome]